MPGSVIYRVNPREEFIDDAMTSFYGAGSSRYQHVDFMRTDVREAENFYELTMNIPGVKKENVKANLKDGYLTIQAVVKDDQDQKDDHHSKYIRRERFSGLYSRSFYVGNDVKQEDIKAKFENGTLILLIPKKIQQSAVEDNRYITIE